MLDIVVREARRSAPGTQNILARLSELMFVEAVRQHLLDLPDTQSGWLAGLRDPVVGRALEALHGAPRDPWTVEQLGRAVGVSRAVLAARFTDMVGHPPMQYLTLWRMQLAARLLAEGSQVHEVAQAVGYESESAFSRTFKRIVGEAPTHWRHRALGAPSPRASA